MRVLVLSFYFAPDLSAGSFRTTVLVESLSKLVPHGSQIDVVTTVPNRYRSFTADAPEHEERGIVSITRLVLPLHRSGMLDQAKAFFAFARSVTHVLEDQEYDLVFATSSRLMTAVLGAWIARKKKARLYLDIRDIFVDTIKDVAAVPVVFATRPLLAFAERWVMTRADKVNLVSEGFRGYFEARYPQQRFSFFTNGIDDEFVAAAPTTSSPVVPRTAPVTVVYAGNIGEGQGLHLLLPRLAKRLADRVKFKIIGDGGRKGALDAALTAEGVTNVELLAPVGRKELLEHYRSADVLFLHLNDYEAFKKVLPSKLFEYAALGKPIWAGVAGYPAEFIVAEVENAAVFAPCNLDDAIRALEALSIADTPRPEFVAKFARAKLSHAMANDILSVID